MLSNKSLRFKINLSIFLTQFIITVIFGSLLAVYETKRRADAMDQIKVTLSDLTRQYSTQLGNEIFARQVIAIEETLKQIIKHHSNIVEITAYDENGSKLVSSGNDTSVDSYSSKQFPSEPFVIQQKWQGIAVLTFVSPIIAYEENVGLWQIHYSLKRLTIQTIQIISIFTALIVSLSFLLGFLINIVMKKFVLAPVYVLQNAMRHIETSDAQGPIIAHNVDSDRNLEKMINSFDQLSTSLQATDTTEDEIASLAYTFRGMLVALKTAYKRTRTDPLTKLHNRLKIDETLEYEIEHSARYHTSFSVILLDIDFFKNVNDKHGHLIGDAVLTQLARLLEGNLRQEDMPCRWGGEEFLILLLKQDRYQATLLAEKLRVLIENENFAEVGRITSSFGVTGYNSGDTAASLISRVDAALYTAKERGRNCVVKI